MACAIEKTVIDILKKNLRAPADVDINVNTQLKELGMDSIALVEMIFELEEKFDITIPNPGEAEHLDTEFKTAGDVVKAVEQIIAESTEAIA
jgi:acyl carrier protein